ncbi:MAG: DUF11 domain-containing protein, partial [Bifidobacteriaceae bacterium]|nr:DUF11 domain-containing protein [Bifidobacteriaceae bacterium]
QVCAASTLDRPLLTIAKRFEIANPPGSVNPRVGDTVHYTVTATNTGAAAFTATAPALIYDDLADVIDDAAGPPANLKARHGDGTAAPAPTFIQDLLKPINKIRWAGVLAKGASVTIEYDLTLKAGGDRLARNIAWSPDDRSTVNPSAPADCRSGASQSTGEPCGLVEHRLPDFSVTKTYAVSPAERQNAPRVGDELTFTIAVVNDSGVDYTADRPLVLIDPLSQTLADAQWIDQPTLTGQGDIQLSNAPAILTYTGALSNGQSATISYKVRLLARADGRFANMVYEPSAPASPQPPACLDPNTGQSLQDAFDPVTGERCARVDVKFPVLRLGKSSDLPGSAAVGTRVVYTVTATNIGAAAFDAANPAVVWDDLSGVLGACATWAGGLSPDGSVYDQDNRRITWSGALEAGQAVAISYQVTTLGCADNELVNVAWQPAQPAAGGVRAPACEALRDGLDEQTGEPCARLASILPTATLAKSYVITRRGEPLANGQVPRAGDVVTYTITAENAGQVPFTDSSELVLRDDLADLERSAVVDADSWTAQVCDQAGTCRLEAGGRFQRSGPAMVWTGPLAANKTLVITFQATLVAGGKGSVRNVVWEPANPHAPSPPVPERCLEAEDSGEACAEVTFQRPALEVDKEADTHGAEPLKTGDTVTFSITITNSGELDYVGSDPARLYDSLEDVLMGARFVEESLAICHGEGSRRVCQRDPEDPALGELSFDDQANLIVWEGPLKSQASLTVVFDAVLEGRGESALHNVAWAPTDPGKTEPPACPAGGVDPAGQLPCDRIELPRSLIHMEKTATVQGQGADDLARAGDVVNYQVVFRNIGDAGYTAGAPAYLYDDISDVLKNAQWLGDLTATAGGAGADSADGYPKVDLSQGLIS